MLSVSNTEPLIDEVIVIKSQGLHPGEEVTFRLETYVDKDQTYFHSFCHIKADQRGIVDLSQHSPINGSYSGIDAMGLFWSMDIIDGQKLGARIFVRDARQPVKMTLELYKGFVDFNIPIGLLKEVVRNSKLLAKVDINRYYLSKDVERHEVRSGRLRGTMFIPKYHIKPMAGIIDLFGVAGGLAEFRAALLASHGFVTYALPFFAYDDLPRDVEDLDVEYFEEAVDWFSQNPNVKSGAVGIIGSSKGGELSLLTASRKPKLKALVGISSPYFHIFCHISIEGKTSEYVSSFAERYKISQDGFITTSESVLYPEMDSVAVIPVENITGDILLFTGEEDHCIESVMCAKKIKERMARHGKESQCTVVSYPQAGHLIEPPYMPLCSKSMNKTVQIGLSYGGEKVGHAFAQKDCWERILSFYREKLKTSRALPRGNVTLISSL